jgi:hypothetical protein
MSLNRILFLSAALACSAYSDNVQQLPAHNGSNIDQPTPSTNPNLFPELRHRSVPTVDLNSLAHISCFISSCEAVNPEGIWSPLLPECQEHIPTPCNPDSFFSSDTDCYTYTLECFCNSPTPIKCEWDCGWRYWMAAEDWFSQTCPDVPPVDFSHLPSCARDCISDGSFNYGCITQSRSCFCLQENLFTCPEKCSNADDQQKIINWYAGTCGYSDAQATAIAAGNPYGKQVGGNKTILQIQPRVYHKLAWYEVLTIWAAAMTVFVVVVVSLMNIYSKWWKYPLYQPLPDGPSST